MYLELLNEAGLTQNGAKVYLALLKLGQSTAYKIAIKSKVHRSNVYDALNRLIEKGLVNEEFQKKERVFSAMHPKKLLELEKERELKLKKAIPSLENLQNSLILNEEAKIYKGISGVKNYLQLILDTKKTVYVIGGKGLWVDPRLKYIMIKFRRESKKLGIKFQTIFDYEIKDKKQNLKLPNLKHRFFPKGYSSQMSIDIFGDFVITFVGLKLGHMETEPIQFVMKSKKLADGYRQLFNCLWNECAIK